jgi:hypothetical protein
MKFSTDFSDLVTALNAESVDYVVVGAWAMAAHGVPRFTGDLDVFYGATPENAARLVNALAAFGFRSADFSVESLLEPETVHYIGHPPIRIDFLNAISGVEFREARAGAVLREVNGVKVPFLGLQSLIANKRSAGRPKDLADLAALRGVIGDGTS